MSMQEYTISGIGFGLSTETVMDNIYKILDFLIDKENVVKQVTVNIHQHEKIIKLIKEANKKNEIDEMEVNILIDELELPYLISAIINYEQNILSVYGNRECAETDTPMNILYERGYPWEFTEREKELEYEDVKEMLMHYAKKLGVTKEEVQYQEYSYIG
jgi:hypothetical protein